MKKKFNNEHTPKSSDVCNKYSKSVSYETLVGGTSTTGRGIKQKESSLILRKAKFQAIFEFVLSSASGGAGGGKYNRISAFVSMLVLLIRRSREKFFKKNFRDDSFSFLASPKDSLHRHSEPKAKNPKKTEKALSFLRLRGASGAQGISAPASCRKAHKRRFLFNSWILRFANASLRMTIPALALILTLITTAESRADDVIPTSGKCNDAGTCLWSLGSDGTLTISAEDGAKDVKMANYNCDNNPCNQSTLISRPWEAYLKQIKSVVIGDNITHIGDDAFQAATNLTSVTGMKDVKTIGSNGVFAHTGLTSITIPDSVTSIGRYAFDLAQSLTNITIPEGVTSIGSEAFGAASSLTSITIPDNIDTKNWAANVFYHLPAGTNIICQGDLNTCYEKLAKYIPTDKGGTCTEYCIKKDILPALFDSCKSTNYFWDGSTCIREPDVTKRKCCTSCKDMGGWCNRIRYTPAEAAKVLKDDNTNSVTITFKK